jgi:RNA polymerase sigma-70 factor (ECF subfamily)
VYLEQDEADLAAVRRCLDGEQAAFEELVRRYQRPLFNVAVRLLGRYDEASDATQNAFVKAYGHLETFDATQRFFSWIYRILRNECLNALRSQRSWEPLSDGLLGAAGPTDAIEDVERQRAVQHAVMALDPEYREVIALRHFADMSYEDIAATLGIPAKTVKSRLYSARQRLAANLSAWKVRI